MGAEPTEVFPSANKDSLISVESQHDKTINSAYTKAIAHDCKELPIRRRCHAVEGRLEPSDHVRPQLLAVGALQARRFPTKEEVSRLSGSLCTLPCSILNTCHVLELRPSLRSRAGKRERRVTMPHCTERIRGLQEPHDGPLFDILGPEYSGCAYGTDNEPVSL